MTSSGEELLERYLSLDLSVKCGYPEFTEEYQAMRYYAIIMILVFPIGIPSLYIVLLFKARRELAMPELRPYYGPNSKCVKSALKTFTGYAARTNIKVRKSVHDSTICVYQFGRIF